MRNRSEDVHRFLRDAFAFFRIQILKRAHVVQTVCEFHEHHANIVHHGQQHLANVLSLLFFAGDVADLRDLCESVDKVRDLFTEVTSDRVEIDERVFDHVMQQPCGH